MLKHTTQGVVGSGESYRLELEQCRDPLQSGPQKQHSLSTQCKSPTYNNINMLIDETVVSNHTTQCMVGGELYLGWSTNNTPQALSVNLPHITILSVDNH